MSAKTDKFLKMEWLHLANKEIGSKYTGKERYAIADEWLDRLYGRFPDCVFEIDDKLFYIEEIEDV
jgi:hypothetical protein